jgi:hypothetical protein
MRFRYPKPEDHGDAEGKGDEMHVRGGGKAGDWVVFESDVAYAQCNVEKCDVGRSCLPFCWYTDRW